MSNQTVVLNNGRQAIINTDTSKIFVWNKEDIRANYTNSTGGEVELLAGTLMGRISGTSLLLPLDSTAVDGSQYPLGILMHDITIPDTETRTLTVCVYGHIVASKVIYAAGEDGETVVADRQLQDRIMSDTKGILLVGDEELSGFDNA